MKNTAAAIVIALAAFATAPCSFADEASAKKNFEQATGSQLSSVRPSPIAGLYEAVDRGNIIYLNEDGSLLIQGHIIDPKARRDLTQERLSEVNKIDFSKFPTKLSIKRVNGNGKRKIATVEDPNCTYCRKIAPELAALKDTTIYTLVVPYLPNSEPVARDIFCSKDPAKAWNALMTKNEAPAPAKESCKYPKDEILKAAQGDLKVMGTPTVFMENGRRIPGFATTAAIEEAARAEK